jgi:hydrogenase-4 membrane subunit HyfE
MSNAFPVFSKWAKETPGLGEVLNRIVSNYSTLYDQLSGENSIGEHNKHVIVNVIHIILVTCILWSCFSSLITQQVQMNTGCKNIQLPEFLKTP